MLIAAGLLRLGTLMKYMPQPVVTGFTAGIAVSIVSSQVKDALGLEMAQVPGEFLARWQAFAAHAGSTRPAAVAMTVLGLAVIVGLRKWKPNWPGVLIALLACTLACVAFALPAETIGSRFGELPSSLPEFHFPRIPFERTFELLPSAFTIAFLAGVESLLSAVVSDGMTGGRHRSNGELVAQGVANVGPALFGGLPATGANFRNTLSAPWGDRLVLLLTFFLTVFLDLTVAIQAGIVLAAFVFMYRMSEAVEVSAGIRMVEDDLHGDDPARAADLDQRAMLPK